MSVLPLFTQPHRLLAMSLALPLILVSLAPQAIAANFLWNSDPFSTEAVDGSGVWNLSDYLWISDAISTPWTNEHPGHTAIFGSQNGVAGTVTITESISLSEIIFNAASSGIYSLVDDGYGQLMFDDGANLVTNAQASLQSAFNVYGDLYKRGNATLTLGG